MTEWAAAPLEIRLAMNAAVALNQMADHYWHGYASVDPGRVFNTSSAGAFRAELAKRNPEFALLRDVAEAHKHVKLDRPGRAVTSAQQSSVGTTGFGEAGFGEGPFGGGPSIVVVLDDGSKRYLSAVADEVLKLWATMLA